MFREKGQAVLIILLVMAVALTVVLSVVGSTTSDIRISSNESESLRAFSAAESGVERALVTNSSAQGFVGDATFNATVTSLASGQKSFNYPTNLTDGDMAVVWFVSHAGDGSLICDASNPCFTGNTVKVCWGKTGTPSGSSTTPAVDVTFYFLQTPGDYSTARIVKAIYDPNSSRLASNSYSSSDPGTCTIGTTNYAFSKTIDVGVLGVPAGSYTIANGMQFMTARVLYNSDQDQSIGFDFNFAGDSAIPSQGFQIDSTGTLNTATRRVVVTNQYVGMSPILGAAMFSATGVVQ